VFAKFVLEQSLIHFPVKWYFYVSIYPAASLRDLESWKQSVREQQFIQNWDQQNVRKAMVTHRLQAYKRNAFIIKLPGEVCILSMALKKQTAWKDPPSYHFLKLLLKIKQLFVNWSHSNFPTSNILSRNKPFGTCREHCQTNKQFFWPYQKLRWDKKYNKRESWLCSFALSNSIAI